MNFPLQTLFLFLLNVLDAFLTIFWVRNGYASEGNHLMATLLDMGDSPFLGVKIGIGAVTAFVLWYWKDRPIAKYGLAIALTAYISLMAIHLITGLSAMGYLSQSLIDQANSLANSVVSIVI